MSRRLLTLCWALALIFGAAGAAVRGEPLAAASIPGDALSGSSFPEPACEDGVVKDDGSVETGWGWIPSVSEGEYVQVYHSDEFPTREVDAVCVCWLRTRDDDEIDFEVVFYDSVLDEDGDPQPADAPYAAIPATAAGVPQGIVGAFTEVDVPEVGIPEGELYVGVRWNAAADRFFFVCADTTAETPRVDVFFRDDRAEGWDNVFATSDPIFVDHRAILVRPRPRQATIVDVPALDGAGLAALGALLAAAGGWVSRRRRARDSQN